MTTLGLRSRWPFNRVGARFADRRWTDEQRRQELVGRRAFKAMESESGASGHRHEEYDIAGRLVTVVRKSQRVTRYQAIVRRVDPFGFHRDQYERRRERRVGRVVEIRISWPEAKAS